MNKEQEKKFHKWLEQFIEGRGHSFRFGFYTKLKTGEVLYDKDYKNWYNNKLKEYNNNF